MRQSTSSSKNRLRFLNPGRVICPRGAIFLAVALASVLVASAQTSEIKKLWTKNCASCHGPDGRGKTNSGREAGVVDLTDPKIHEKYTVEQMFTRVKEGVKEGDKVKMQPAENLTDVEIKKLIAYVRKFNKTKKSAK